MTNDSYKIILSISHHRIAYEYWQRDGENKLVPMPGGVWPEPLAFHCSDSCVAVGQSAVRAVQQGSSKAFDRYFERLTGDNYYDFGGQSRPVRNLLLDASECLFRDFYRTVLFNRVGNLDDNRADMPLILVCESDIKANERALLQGLFRDSGYSAMRVVDYDKYIERFVRQSLARDYVCDNVLVAWAEGSDLTLTLYDIAGSRLNVHETFAGLGTDPRKSHVKRLIWDQFVGQDSWLHYRDEEQIIDRIADDFLNSDKPLVSEWVQLSGGASYSYSLQRLAIENMPCNESVTLRERLDTFLRAHDIADRSRTVLLLRGKASGNSYFEQNMSRGFAATIKSDRSLRDATMALLLAESKSAPSPTTAPAQTAIQPPAPKQSQPPVQAVLVAEVLPPLPPVPPPIPQMPDFDSEAAEAKLLKELKRKWREVRAAARGKERSGALTDAIAVLDDFANELTAVSGVETLMTEINDECRKMRAQIKPQSQSAIQPKTEPKRINERTVAEPPKPQKADKGRELINAGQLSEARDWYRSQGNNDKAGQLGKIIRAQKSVDRRFAELDGHRKNKDRKTLERIVTEIDEFVALCKSADVDAAKYRQLLNEYKKL